MSLHMSLSCELKQTKKSAHQTQGLPVLTEHASWEHQRSEGSHQNTNRKGNNRKGVSAEGRARTGWSAVGGELLLRRGMIFLRLYILGLYLTWSSGSLQEQQLWARLKLGQGELRKGADRVTLAEKEKVSLWLGLWKVEAVGCNLWSWRQRARTVLLVFFNGRVCRFLSVRSVLWTGYFVSWPAWCLWWHHCRTERDVEVLHYQSNYKVGDSVVRVSVDVIGPVVNCLSSGLTAAVYADISDI